MDIENEELQEDIWILRMRSATRRYIDIENEECYKKIYGY